ncbi:CHASE2 domain-containing protein [Desulfobacter latus]|uniref:Adenylate/guanylate cyclase domain-containing protein n=1 Tax=Desulfobacter latus TaxID=2292 RepID=A0A850T587_9BACT|nr:adenylate/guanylate cyclase domain-containing protein [Desulfobacter latus]NWH03458.1 adenylate/guanylate cyclase domain-containing protein [Desulfobacter latus]
MKKNAKGLARGQWLVFLAGIVLTLALAGVYVFKPVYLEFMELKLYDVFVHQTYTPLDKSPVVIVDIDEYSLENVGQWPWPRYRLALLLKKLQMAGALAVGNDILFGEKDHTSPAVLKAALKKDLKVDLEFTGLPNQLMDNDTLLANVLETGPFVLGYSFYFREDRGGSRPGKVPPLNFTQVSAPGAGPAHASLISAIRAIPPLSVLMDKGTGAGFMNALTDVDGVVRRVPLVISWQDKLYPHLSLATILKAFEGRIPDPVIQVGSGGVESLVIGNLMVPLEADGAMLINYKGPSYQFPYVSAGRVLEDKVSPDTFKNKIVLIGSSAAGLMDQRTSPLDDVFPGIEVNATIIHNILTQSSVSRPDWVPGLELAGILVWGVLTSIIGSTEGRLILPITGLLAGLAWYASIWGLESRQIWISPFFSLLVMGCNFSFLNLFRFWLSERKRRFYRSAFSRYVSKTVVDEIARSPEKLSLEGQEKEISIMFSDIRGFTSLSEKLSPTRITNLLHDYFTPVTRGIIKNKGTLDKFIGDAVMCFWNAPLDVKNHQDLAVKTGLEMLESVKELNKEFIKKYGIEIAIGIGIHTGQCRVGNMGSVDLFDYTIIGDNVNLASRLEGLTKFYGVGLVVSESVKKNTGRSWIFQELDRVRVKGKNEPVGIYTVLAPDSGHKEQLAQELKEYNRGLSLYKKRKFDQALGIFSSLGAAHSGKKIYSLYMDRCRHYLEESPEEDWDGVFTHMSK